jgi:hypothetical protein
MLRDFLDRNRIQYLVISHSVAYTAQEIAFNAGSYRQLVRMKLPISAIW